jgi:predicted PurR-regulated permease PerM
MENDPAPADRRSNPVITRPAVRAMGLAAATLLGAALCVVVVYPLLAPLLWAAVLAMVARPLHRRVEQHIHNRSAAAALVVAALAVLVALPFAFVASQLLQEVADVAARMKSGEVSRLWHEALARQPLLATLVRWIERHVDLESLVTQWTGGTAGLLQRLLAGSIAGAAGWLIMFFVLFFFLRDRVRLLEAVERYLPLTRAEMPELFKVAADTVHAIVWGSLAVALLQGTLGGLVFWWLELPAPLVWGAVMALLAMLPVLGAAIVWVPAAAWFALQGQWSDALVLTAFGAIVIGLIDNLVYPLIVKDRLHLHAVPVFVAIVGGLIVFGASGLVLGPLLLAVTDTLVKIWRRRLGLQAA